MENFVFLESVVPATYDDIKRKIGVSSTDFGRSVKIWDKNTPYYIKTRIYYSLIIHITVKNEAELVCLCYQRRKTVFVYGSDKDNFAVKRPRGRITNKCENQIREDTRILLLTPESFALDSKKW